MEQLSLWNFGDFSSEFEKFKYYFFKTFLSFKKLSWGMLSLILQLVLVGPVLFRRISPGQKEMVGRIENPYWPRKL